MTNLTHIPTRELLHELLQREAVEEIQVAPHEVYEIKLEDTSLNGVGPVIVLVISD